MSTLETANAARGRWPGVLQALGIDAKYLQDVHGPCPACGGKDRFRFDDKMNGNFFCSHCGAGDGFVLLQKVFGWDFKKAAAEVDRVVGNCPLGTPGRPEMTEAQKRDRIRKVLQEAKPIDGTPAEAYLLGRCGLLDGLTHDLRYHPALNYSRELGAFPALLAILRYPDGKGASVHRTYLTPDGRKAPVDPVRKIMPGFPLGGSSVRLGAIQDHLGVAEGIETAICAGKRFGLPVWAAISAAGLEAWEPPPGVKRVVVFGDCDASYTGQASAFVLAKKLRNLGLEVSVEIPPEIGKDWCDMAEVA
jgi:putative DNA primase/helicase